MKYYQLMKDLPTFKEGELFFIDGRGNLISCAHEDIVAYSEVTLKKFPSILENWFREVPAPERDSKTKYAFMEYISDHRDERFFQAIRNFAREHIQGDFKVNFLYASDHEAEVVNSATASDTFYWECDEMLKGELDDEEQRADEY